MNDSLVLLRPKKVVTVNVHGFMDCKDLMLPDGLPTGLAGVSKWPGGWGNMKRQEKQHDMMQYDTSYRVDWEEGMTSLLVDLVSFKRTSMTRLYSENARCFSSRNAKICRYTTLLWPSRLLVFFQLSKRVVAFQPLGGVHVIMLMTRRKHIEHADSWLGWAGWEVSSVFCYLDVS